MSANLLDKKEERIRRMFGDIAPRYDLLNHLLSFNVDKYWRRRTTKIVAPLGTDPILDVCTGTGDLALAYHRVCNGSVDIIGSDFCHPMLVRAVAKAKGTVSFVEADAQKLPFPSSTFQITTVAFGLRNVTNYEVGLSELSRVTKPGGRVAILEFSKPRHWLFGRLYRAYFRYLLPLIGQIFSRSKDSAYKYLPASVLEFPDYEALVTRMEAHGLHDVKYHSLTFGIATLYVGIKS
jgi:demethylmenaquinone methyltransferase/2-methoxy-6-polyprenyl-1,4-benzoquinol methylase